jgi:hypothetical protein
MRQTGSIKFQQTKMVLPSSNNKTFASSKPTNELQKYKSNNSLKIHKDLSQLQKYISEPQLKSIKL